eukprot:5238456-Pyramimonas_sp.AAC.1
MDERLYSTASYNDYDSRMMTVHFVLLMDHGRRDPSRLGLWTMSRIPRTSGSGKRDSALLLALGDIGGDYK